jgi:ribokinase
MMGLVTTNVAVFGSCNMDLVAYVSTAPGRGETVLGREFHTVPGGKGANQAIAAGKAGARVQMIGAVGSDDFGTRIRENLIASNVEVKGLRTVPGHSGTAHIVVDDQGGNSIVVIPGANQALDALAAGDEELIAASDSLLLQLEVPFSGVAAAAQAARRHGVRVILTPAPAAQLGEDILSNVDMIVPNEHEAAVLTGSTDPEQALAALLRDVPEAVITLGQRGALYGNRDGETIQVPALPVTAVDTTAAGDTFVGVLATALGEGRPVREALRRASAAAAIAVQRPGASSSMPTEKEITDLLASR